MVLPRAYPRHDVLSRVSSAHITRAEHHRKNAADSVRSMSQAYIKIHRALASEIPSRFTAISHAFDTRSSQKSSGYAKSSRVIETARTGPAANAPSWSTSTKSAHFLTTPALKRLAEKTVRGVSNSPTTACLAVVTPSGSGQTGHSAAHHGRGVLSGLILTAAERAQRLVTEP